MEKEAIKYFLGYIRGRALKARMDGEVFVQFPIIEIGEALKRIEEEEGCIELLKPVRRFLFIEDGSVDLDIVQNELAERSPDTYIIVYRQGSTPPKIVEV